MWTAEKVHLLPQPEQEFEAWVRKLVSPNPYSQVVLSTHRYSVPTTTHAQPLTLKAYAFEVEVLLHKAVIARHGRGFGGGQDILVQLHYLGLLQQRAGAFDHVQPLRQWRASLPAVYEQLLHELGLRWPQGRGMCEILSILKLHQKHSPAIVAKAVHQTMHSFYWRWPSREPSTEKKTASGVAFATPISRSRKKWPTLNSLPCPNSTKPKSMTWLGETTSTSRSP